ncbi:METTL9 [Symbiodinium sp. CCMP2456]|nr:METTL9 [Symbiodinium sp. CCMP2456]
MSMAKEWRQKKEQNSGSHFAPSYPSPCQPDQGAPSKITDYFSNPRRSQVGADSGLDGRQRRLVLREMVPHNEAVADGQIPASPTTHGGGPPTQHAALQHERRDNTELPQHPDDAESGGAGGHISSLQAGSQSTRAGCTGSARSPDPIRQQLRDGIDRHVSPERASAARTNGAAAGQADLWQLGGSTARDANPVPRAGDAFIGPTPQHQPPLFRLLNPGNQCYLNAAVYSLWLAARAAPASVTLPQVLRVNKTGCFRARQLLGFHLLAWPQPERQHDIAELLAHLLPKLAAQLATGGVEARRLLSAGLQRTLDTPITQCIVLPAPPRHTGDLQDLLLFWHRQDAMHALDALYPWLYLQLPRFEWAGHRAHKTTQAYHFADTLQVPVYQNAHDLEVRWVPYRTCCYVQHHGAAPNSGHYTVIQANPSQPWLLDDAKDPRPLNAHMYDHACRNMYVVVLTLGGTKALYSSTEPSSEMDWHAAQLFLLEYQLRQIAADMALIEVKVSDRSPQWLVRGAGGGMQIFFPANVTGRPWEVSKWANHAVFGFRRTTGSHGVLEEGMAATRVEPLLWVVQIRPQRCPMLRIDTEAHIIMTCSQLAKGLELRCEGPGRHPSHSLRSLRPQWTPVFQARAALQRWLAGTGPRRALGAAGGRCRNGGLLGLLPGEGALARVLCWCLSKTDVNALLGRGEMFVLSATQALRLFPERPGGLLLDVGAGTGSCTMELAQLFDHVLTTEVSRPMVAQLRRRGLPVLEGSLSGLEAMAAEVEIPLGPGGTFDCIALMNVLDRCSRPRSLLQELRRRLTPPGRLLIAVVLPFRPFVEHGIFRLQPEEMRRSRLPRRSFGARCSRPWASTSRPSHAFHTFARGIWQPTCTRWTMLFSFSDEPATLERLQAGQAGYFSSATRR